MATLKVYIFLGVFLIELACGLGLVKRLVEKNKLGETSGLTFLRVTSLSETEDGKLLIVDNYASRVKLVSKKGYLIKEFGKRGKGKGDFSRMPYLVSTFKDGLAIVEFNSPRVLIYDRRFNFLNSFNVDGTIVDISFDKYNNLWLGVLDLQGRAKLVKLDLRGNILNSIELKYGNTQEIGIFKNENKGVMNLFCFDISKFDMIVVGYLFLNRIEIWNINGSLIREFKINGLPDESEKKLISVKLFSREYIPKGFILKDIAVDDNIYILGGSYSENPHRDLYVFNFEGELINKLILPEKAFNIYLSTSKELITIEKKGSLVKIYDLN